MLTSHADDLVLLLQRAATPGVSAVPDVPEVVGVLLPPHAGAPSAPPPAMTRGVPLPSRTRGWTPANEAKVKRDRKGRFAEKNAAAVLGELDEVMDKLRGLFKHMSEGERSDLDDAMGYLKDVRKSRQEVADSGGPDFFDIDSEQYHNLQLSLDHDDNTVTVDYDDGALINVSPHDAEEIAQAIDDFMAKQLPAPAPGKLDERTTSSGNFKIVHWGAGSLEVGPSDADFSENDSATTEANLLLDPTLSETNLVADALEELAHTAAQSSTAATGGQRAGMSKEKFAELVAEKKVHRGPGGKFAKKTSSVAEKLGLDEVLDVLRNATSKDRGKVTEALAKAKLKRPELAELASKLSTVKKPTKRTTIKQLTDDILEGTVGFRERAEAIGGFGLPGKPIELRDDTPKAKTSVVKPANAPGPKMRIDEITEQLKNTTDRDQRSKLQAERRRLRDELVGTKPAARPKQARPNQEEFAANMAAISGDPDIWGKLKQAHQEEDAAKSAAKAEAKPAPGPVVRRISGNPRKPNTWGGAHGANDVHYHADGAIGMAVSDLGPDAQVEVRGDSLVNVLDRLATDTVAGRMSAQQQADELKKLAGELPEGPGKRAVAGAAEDLDVPRIDIDGTWAKGAEPALDRFPVLRDLAHKLEAVPLARGATIPGGPGDTRELDKLHNALEQFSQGKLGGLRFLAAIKDLRDGRHESREGRFEIDRVVSDAVAELERMQKADRQSLYPNTEGGGVGPKADGGGGADALALADDRLMGQRVGGSRTLAEERRLAAAGGPRGAQAAAQVSTARFHLLHDRAKVLARVEAAALIGEWVDDPELVSSGKLRRQLDTALVTHSLTDDPRFAGLGDALDSGDRSRVLAVLDEVAQGAGLRRIGGNPGDGFDQIVTFDRRRYESRDPSLRPGQKVRLVAPGYAADGDNGEEVVIEKAVVEAATPEEIEQNRAGRRSAMFQRASAEPATATEVKAAGLAVVAADTGRVLMLQRALTDDDPAGGTWELPGGKLDPGEDPLDAARREWQEETGCELPAGKLAGKWHNGVYCGYVWSIGAEDAVPIHDGRDEVINPDDPDQDQIESLAWWDRGQLTRDNPAIRPELRQSIHKMLNALDGLAPVEVERETYSLERAADLDVAGWNAKHPKNPKGGDGKWAQAPGGGKLSKALGRLNVDPQWLKTAGHLTLDVVGWIPGWGEPADLINAAWYLAERDYRNAAISGLAAIPVAGDTGKAIKGIKKVAKWAKAGRQLKDAKKVVAKRSADVAGAAAGREAFGINLADVGAGKRLVAAIRKRWGTDPRPWAAFYGQLAEQAGEDDADAVLGQLWALVNGDKPVGEVPEDMQRAATRSHQRRKDWNEDDVDRDHAGRFAEDADVDVSPWDSVSIFGGRDVAGQHIVAFDDPDKAVLPSGGRGVAMRNDENMGEIRRSGDLQESTTIPVSDVDAVAGGLDRMAKLALDHDGSGDGLTLLGSEQVAGYHVAAFHDPHGEVGLEGDTLVAMSYYDSGADAPWGDIAGNSGDFEVFLPDEVDDLTAALRDAARARPKRRQGLDRKIDKLRLDGRIDLGPGEQLTASAKVEGSADYDAFLAATNGPDGPRLRLGIPYTDGDDRQWDAGDRGDTVVLDAAGLDAFDAAMAEAKTAALKDRARFKPLFSQEEAFRGQQKEIRENAPLPADLQAQFDDLSRQIDELRSGSAAITELRALRARLRGGEVDAADRDAVEARIAELVRHPDVERSDDLGNARNGILWGYHHAKTPSHPMPPQQQAEFDRIEEQIDQLWRGVEVDDKIASGVVPAQWGNLVWEVHGTDGFDEDDADEAWQLRFAVAPPGSDPDWDIWNDGGGEKYVLLVADDLAGFMNSVRKIATVGGFPAPSTRSGVEGHVRSADLLAVSIVDRLIGDAYTPEQWRARAQWLARAGNTAGFVRHPGHPDQKVHGRKKKLLNSLTGAPEKAAQVAKAPAAKKPAATKATPAPAVSPPRYRPELDAVSEGWLRIVEADGKVRIPGTGSVPKTQGARRRAERQAAELGRLADRDFLKANKNSEYVLTSAGRSVLARQRQELADAERRWTDVPSPRVPGRDVAGDTDLARRVLADAVPDSTTGRLQDRGSGDRVAEALARELGLDAHPQLASPAEFKRLIRNGEIKTQLYRGVQQGELRKPAAQIQQEMRAGPLHIGLGTFGNGIYMAESKRHASSPDYSEKGNPLSVGHFGLRSDAKTITWRELLAEQDRWEKETFDGLEPSGPLGEVFADPGRWAMARGYDAIFIPEGDTPGVGQAAQGDQWAILNRSALIAEVPGGA